ncbi:hypothetical protein GCM10009681_07350 [Luedemannella helvata]|uniref:Uncharacterized protein n=1 Tax=Luedemannella helvata TaxID=349315 RepID=A0ABP4VY22_9ACTN
MVRQDAFLRRLIREYALVGTVSALTAKGFEVQVQVEKASGEIRVVLRRGGEPWPRRSSR